MSQEDAKILALSNRKERSSWLSTDRLLAEWLQGGPGTSEMPTGGSRVGRHWRFRRVLWDVN